MVGKGIDTMTIIKSICSGVGALSAVLLCASVLWSEMGDLDNEKLDEKIFTQYRKDEAKDKAVYRAEERLAHSKISEVLVELTTDVGIVKTILEERREK